VVKVSRKIATQIKNLTEYKTSHKDS